MIKLLEKNPIGIIAVFLAAVALFLIYFEKTKILDEIGQTQEELTLRQTEFHRDLDSKIESMESKILKLRRDGFAGYDDFSDLSKKALAATVLVESRDKTESAVAGAGSGFFANSRGFIVTALHVVEAIGKNNLVVKPISGKAYPAKVVAEDSQSDIAILKIAAKSPAYLSFGYYKNFEIGEEIGFAGYSINTGVSNPLIHRGVVSSKGVDLAGVKMFTINAFVNTGNSGGPVFSAKTGRVLGVLNARQRDVSSDKYIAIPEGYSSGITLGNVDPLKLNVELYNETLRIVGDVSQVGIGIAYSAEAAIRLISRF